MDVKNIEEQALARKQYEIEVCEMALDHWGITTQSIKCIEELAELQVELAKTVNLDHRKDKFIDEMVDAELTLLQMKLAYFPTWESLQEYDAHKRDKLHALENRINLDRQKI